MKNFDESLRDALRRESPPAGFRDRLMQRVAQTPRTRSTGRWQIAAALALLTTGTITAYTIHHVQRQREGERTRAQVMLALRIAGKKVHYAREEVRDTLKGTTR